MKALSFFSGCLGLDLGLHAAGIDTILFCENDKNAKNTIRKNKPDVPLISDILDYTPSSILEAAGLKQGKEVELIVGGPPCQAFSTAGKRASFVDPRGNVFLHFIHIIEEIKPKYFVIENVRGLLSASLKHRPHNLRGGSNPPLTIEEMPGGALNLVLKKLQKSGYDISFNLYNTANYGTPQKRERMILIGSLSGRVPHIPPTHSEGGIGEFKNWCTFRDIASDLNNDDGEFVKFSEKRLKYYRMLSEGQYWKNLPETCIKEAMGASYFAGGGKTGFYRRIAWDKPSPTLVTHPAMPATDLCHPERLRPLSVEEYKRIQQFPDEYQLDGTTIQKYKQLGNAVPVGFGQTIGELLIEHNNGKNVNDDIYSGFAFSRYKNTSEKTWFFDFEESNQVKFDFATQQNQPKLI
jgi:DNA (cytosine-5)-methyltransferase 1